MNYDDNFKLFFTLFLIICMCILLIYKNINNMNKTIQNQMIEIETLKGFIHNEFIKLNKVTTQSNKNTNQINNIYEENITCGYKYITTYDNILCQYIKTIVLIKYNKYITDLDISNNPLKLIHQKKFINYKKLELFPNLTKLIYSVENQHPLLIFDNILLSNIKHIIIKYSHLFSSICNLFDVDKEEDLYNCFFRLNIETIEINININTKIYDNKIYIPKKYNLLKIFPLLKNIKINIDYDIQKINNYYNDIINIIERYKQIWKNETNNITFEINEAPIN